MNTTTQTIKNATTTVSKAVGSYGTPEPQIEVRAPKGTHFRHVKAALYRLAAEIELATPARESWVVQVDDDRERVYLELGDGDEAEAARGLALLHAIVR